MCYDEFYNSYKITDKTQQTEILTILYNHDQLYPSKHPWGRTVYSMLIEWEMHNYLYGLSFKNERLAHTDFDKDSEDWTRGDYCIYAFMEVWNGFKN